MKNKMMRMVAMLALVMTFAVLSVSAQVRVERLTATIDFDFVAGGQTLPAGQYRFSFPGGDGSRRIVLITKTDGSAQALVQILPVQNQTESDAVADLIFNQYGDQRYLASVQLGDDSYRQELIKSSDERRLARSGKGVKTVAVKVDRKGSAQTTGAAGF